MKEHPEVVMNLCIYKDISKYTQVFNKNALEYITWINIPTELCHIHRLFQVDQILPNTGELDISSMEQQCHKPWIKVPTDALDTSIGQHIYKMSFINTSSNDILSMYFSYIIQSDNPDTPYIYMDRDNTSPSFQCDCQGRYEGVV